MGQKRIRHSADFTTKVALEAVKGLKTVNELAPQYQLSPMKISQWKRQVMAKAKELFGSAHRAGSSIIFLWCVYGGRSNMNICI